MTSLKVLVAGIGAALLATCTPFHSGSQSGTPGVRTTPTWGALPTPLFHPDYAAVPSWSSAPEPDLYADPVTITWSGKLNLSITNAPVFRYSEPTFAEANRFATGLHATAESDTRSSGRSWSYGNTDEDFRVVVIGSADARGTGPTYLIFPAPDTPVEPASVGPLNRAMTFLNGHHLLPEWPRSVVTQAGATQSAAIFEREFDIAGYGPASLVDQNGARGGLAVSFDGDRLLEVAGLFPLTLQPRDYGILSADNAYRSVYGAPRPVPPGSPTVLLTRADLVYVVVPAGDHGFYEPAYLFSGTFQIRGTVYVKHVLVSAIDPSRNA